MGSTKRRANGTLSRRQFMGGAAAAITIIPGSVLGLDGQPPAGERLNVAQIGCGGKGGGDIKTMAKLGCNVVGLCDADYRRAAGTFKAFGKAAKFKDFRKMLTQMDKQIDAVVVTTPDHTHAVAAIMAMKMGKHVYCQKPLTRTVHEARLMTETARKYKVATQMGNQGHGSGGVQATAEYLAAGAIGTVREVHVWTDRPGRRWRQGQGRPPGTPAVPEGLDWDLWLGPAAERAYHPSYLPFIWRGWWDFGTGALGDMACHHMDGPFFALKLTAPTSVKVQSCSPFNGVSYPAWSIIEWQFPAVGDRPAVKMIWYDGGKVPPPPAELEKDRKMGSNGVLYIGDKGAMLAGGSGSAGRIVPETKMQAFGRPERVLPRSFGHYPEWIAAAKGESRDGKPIVPGTNFDYSGPMTEAILLGNIALTCPDETLEWDARAMKITNNPDANKLLHYEYRKGWTL